MAVEFLIALLLLTALMSGVAGYALARRGAPKRSHLDALRRDLEAAERRAEEVQANVTGHFEQSAVLFGQLARDYRSFLEHFSESAQALGISEVKARELLARADQPLLGQTEEVIDGETASASARSPGKAAAEPASIVGETPVDVAAGADASGTEPSADATSREGASADELPVAATTSAKKSAGDAPVRRRRRRAAAVPVDEQPHAPGAERAREPQVTADTQATGEAVEPEPPLVNDVVEPAAKRARVVDVEVDALGLPIEDADRERAAGLSKRS